MSVAARRAFMLLMRAAQKPRVMWYRIISNPLPGTHTRIQAMNAAGLGTTVCDGMAMFGVSPSPLLPVAKDVLPRAAVAGDPALVIREIQKIDGVD